MAANRVGKSEAGAYEVTCHATGLYPSWWTGRRFHAPVEIWASGTNSQTTRDIVSRRRARAWCRRISSCRCRPLAGSPAPSKGADPACLGRPERARVQDVQQGRPSFEGTAKHVIWDDEEPPADVYTEQLYRDGHDERHRPV